MIEDRLAELRVEAQRGREEMARLEQRRTELQAVLLRISGAIQVLEELQTAEDPGTARVAAG